MRGPEVVGVQVQARIHLGRLRLKVRLGSKEGVGGKEACRRFVLCIVCCVLCVVGGVVGLGEGDRRVEEKEEKGKSHAIAVICLSVFLCFSSLPPLHLLPPHLLPLRLLLLLVLTTFQASCFLHLLDFSIEQNEPEAGNLPQWPQQGGAGVSCAKTSTIREKKNSRNQIKSNQIKSILCAHIFPTTPVPVGPFDDLP